MLYCCHYLIININGVPFVDFPDLGRDTMNYEVESYYSMSSDESDDSGIIYHLAAVVAGLALQVPTWIPEVPIVYMTGQQ